MKHHSTTRRDGAVLLVVLAMLALFAVIGLSFVFYAESRATSARIYRESQELGASQDTPDPQHLMAFSQLIYGTTNGPSGVFSMLRGHDLARMMYGYSYEGNDPENPIIGPNTNSVAYGGMGPVPADQMAPYTQARLTPLLNYQWKFDPTTTQPTIIDPERTRTRSQPNDSFNPTSRYIGKNESVTYPSNNDVAVALVNPVNGNVIVPSFHRPWAFNGAAYMGANEYLKQRALAPPPASGSDPTKPGAYDGNGNDWTNQSGRHRIARPRAVDHNGFFPYPPPNADNTHTGDVQNLPGAAYPFLNPDGSVRTDAAGNPILIPKNDSVWLDIGAPVQIWNGRRVKPLFAFLVVPTNNRVNINSSGSLRSTDASGNRVHDSGQGLFPSEVNPKFVLNNSPANTYFNNEYYRLKTAQYGSNYAATPFPSGVVPTAPLPNPPGRNALNTVSPPGGYVPPASAALDWDGTGMVGAMRMLMAGQQNLIGPGNTVNVTHSAFGLSPRFVGPTIAGTSYNRYGSGDTGDAAPVEQLQHPYFWNPYLHRPRTNMAAGAMTFTEADLRKLHAKWADDTGLTNDTLLGALAPISFGAMKSTPNPILPTPYVSTGPGKSLANRDRFNLTTRSNGLALHNLMPMTVNFAGSMTPYQWAVGQPVPTGLVPSTIDPFNNGAYGLGTLANSIANGIGTDFDRVDANNVKMRAGVGALPALDLNRPLTDYRHPLAIKYNLPLRPDNVIMPTALQLATWYTNNGITAAMIAATPGLADGAIVANHFTVNAYTSTTLLFNAMRDRQELAKEIFARLVVATGASATYMKWNGYCLPNPAIDVSLGVATNPDYDALRYLAQLAANIVDYIDGDDVATTFVWHPVNPQVTSSFDPTVLTGLAAPTGVPAPNDSNFSATPGAMGNRVVVGTEKPKLVVNEAYCELANDTTEAGTNRAQRPLELRFLLELMNPSANDALNGNETKPYHSTTPALNNTNPAANAVLYYGPNQQIANPFNPTAAPYSPYVVDLHLAGNAALNEVAGSRSNVLGINQAIVPARRVDFAALAGNSIANPATGYPTSAAALARSNPRVTALLPEADPAYAGVVPPTPQFVGPVGTKYAPLPAPLNPVNQGYLVLAPASIPGAPGNAEFNPATWDATGMTYTLAGGSQYDAAVMVPADPPTPGVPTMGLTIPYGPNTPQNDNQIGPLVTQANADAPAVMVRRLANPYLPPNDPTFPATYVLTLPPNPYLIADVLPAIHVNDGVRLGVHPTLPPPAPSNRPTNTPPRHERYAVAKGHPFVSLPNLIQRANVDPAPVLNDFPANTFFRHNGPSAQDPESPIAGAPVTPGSTTPRNPLVAPINSLLLTNQGAGRLGFEWLVHLDRPLVNQLELLNVPAVPPHMLTLSFATGDLATQPNPLLPNYSVRFHNHTAAWTDTSLNLFPPQPNLANQSRLYRALELLRVKPWNYAMPNGGRVPGKININLITDPNVLKALADPQNGDFFQELFGTVDPASGQQLDALVDTVNYNPTDAATNMRTVFSRLQSIRGGGTTPTMNVVTSNQYDPTRPPASAISTIQVPGPNDKPFRSLGNAANASGYFPAGKGGVTETALNGVFDLNAQTHPYNKASLLRKVHNNLTTTSEVFEVYLTVGFFSVENSGPYYTNTGDPATSWRMPQLGKEVFRDVPGDTRHKYFAVVDRTNLSLDPASAVLPPTSTQYSTRRQGAKPVFTDVVNVSAPVLSGANYTSTLQFHASAGFAGQGVTIRYDQTPDETNDFPIVVGTRLKIGTGVNAEWVQVVALPTAGTVGPNGTLFDTNTGIATVTVLRNIGIPVAQTGVPAPADPRIVPALPIGTGAGQYPELPTHAPGTAICNVPLGNPGPQPGFDPTQPNYKAVMPYLIKLDQ